jgi:hypothetical protein
MEASPNLAAEMHSASAMQLNGKFNHTFYSPLSSRWFDLTMKKRKEKERIL